MNIASVLLVWVFFMFPARWLLTTLRVPEPFALLLFVGALFWTQMWLFAKVRCHHCGRLVRPDSLSIDGFVFWQKYLFFRGTCPHCGRAASGWWY